MPYQVFATADGHIVIAVGNDGQFRQLVTVLGAPQLADNPLSATNEARVANRAVLVPELARLIAPFSRADLLARLETASVPAGPINAVDEVFADPQVVHRAMRIDLPHGSGATLPSVRTPIVMSETPLASDRAAPMLGEHTADVLAELGHDAAEIARLADDGVVVRRAVAGRRT